MKTATNQILLGLAILFVFFGMTYAWETGLFGLFPRSLEQYASSVVRTCSRDVYPPRCYDTEIPKLMDQGLSMEEAFEVARHVQDKVDGYFYCHVLGHNLSAKETAKDPERWTSVVARCPTGMCSNGCLHGAAQERFRNDELTDEEVRAILPQISTVCTSESGRDFTGLEEASCNHSLGHLSMYVTGGDIRFAVDVCDVVAHKGTRDFSTTCYEGAFMQIFQPLDPEDFGLVKDIPATTTELAKEFCDSFSGERRAACHRESWPLYRDTLATPEGAEAFCSLVPGQKSERLCYNALFYLLSAQLSFDIDRISTLCTDITEDRKGQCFANSASRMIETDYRLIPKAVELCERAEAEGVGERCYDELVFYSTFNFHRDSESYQALCKALPEPWQTKCVNWEVTNTPPSVNDP